MAENEKVHIAACSRTEDPPAARQALRELYIPTHLTHQPKASDSDEVDQADLKSQNLVSSIELFDSLEIYPCTLVTALTTTLAHGLCSKQDQAFHSATPEDWYTV